MTYRNCALAALVLLSACGKKVETAQSLDQNAAGVAQAMDGPGAGPTAAPPVAPTGVPISVGEATLTAPNDFQIAVTFYKVVGLEPPLDEWAKTDPRAQSANEFDRPAVASRIQQELMLAARSVAGIGYIELNSSSNFGEYDMAAQGFRLSAFDSSKFYTWNYKGANYKLTMENGNGASLWKISPQDAKAIVERMSYRSVDLKMRIKIIGALPEGQGGTMQGKVVSYEVFDSQQRKLGGMAFN